VYLGDGKGRWRGASEGLPAPDIHGLYWGIAVGDVNNDGKPDIVSGAAIPGVEVFIQGEGGRFYNTSATQCAGGTNDTKFCMADGDCTGGTCATSTCRGLCTGGPRSGQVCTGKDDCPEGSCALGADFGKACGGTAVSTCPSSCTPVNNLHGIVAMNALGVALGDLDKDGNLDLVAAGKTDLEEIGGVYGIHPFKGDGKGNWVHLQGTGLPETGRERTWGVAIGDVNGDGVLDIAAAFGDVLPPTWRSGKPKKESEKGKAGEAKDKEKPKDPTEKAKGPERGRFGSLEVWTGRLTSH
jgi:hypothetical protein